jgi:predicted PurR-regulated permease PerM
MAGIRPCFTAYIVATKTHLPFQAKPMADLSLATPPVPDESGVIERRWIDIAVGAGVVLLVVAGCMKVILPFLSPLLWAVVLCLATGPLYERIKGQLRGNRSLAALLMTLSLAVVAIAPFAIAFWSLSDEAKVLTKTITEEIEHWPPPMPEWVAALPTVGPRIKSYWEEPSTATIAERAGEVSRIMASARSLTVRVVKAIGHGILQTLVSLFVGFFIYRDGETLAVRLRSVIVHIAGKTRGARLVRVAHSTILSVIYGILGTALLQGLVAEVGFWTAGVPGAFLLAFLTFAVGIIPFGPLVIWAPAVLWLFHQGNHGAAVFLLVWSMGGHGAVDGLIKPILISRGGSMPLVLVVLGVLGGAAAFGFIGVFLGPTLLAVGYRWLDEWSAEVVASP